MKTLFERLDESVKERINADKETFPAITHMLEKRLSESCLIMDLTIADAERAWYYIREDVFEKFDMFKFYNSFK